VRPVRTQEETSGEKAMSRQTYDMTDPAPVIPTPTAKDIDNP